LVVIALTVAVSGQTRSAADARKDIAEALSAAGKDGKPVLLDFGAEWCLDCRVLWKALEDPAVAKFVKDNFHLVDVETGEYFVGPNSPKATDHQVRWSRARTFSVADVLTYLKEMAKLSKAAKGSRHGDPK
jgi:thiol-disulfide isomerase/thioredoxin